MLLQKLHNLNTKSQKYNFQKYEYFPPQKSGLLCCSVGLSFKQIRFCQIKVKCPESESNWFFQFLTSIFFLPQVDVGDFFLTFFLSFFFLSSTKNGWMLIGPVFKLLGLHILVIKCKFWSYNDSFSLKLEKPALLFLGLDFFFFFFYVWPKLDPGL